MISQQTRILTMQTFVLASKLYCIIVLLFFRWNIPEEDEVWRIGEQSIGM